MRYIEYDPIFRKLEEKLNDAEYITFSTAVHNKVTARTVSHVNSGLDVMFLTRSVSEKTQQLKLNPYVALALPTIQIEAVARICGSPQKESNSMFSLLYKEKFPRYYSYLATKHDAVVIKCEPRKITLYTYEDNHPFRYILEVDQKIAYKLEE